CANVIVILFCSHPCQTRIPQMTCNFAAQMLFSPEFTTAHPSFVDHKWLCGQVICALFGRVPLGFLLSLTGPSHQPIGSSGCQFQCTARCSCQPSVILTVHGALQSETSMEG